jgi:hypothetical protein
MIVLFSENLRDAGIRASWILMACIGVTRAVLWLHPRIILWYSAGPNARDLLAIPLLGILADFAHRIYVALPVLVQTPLTVIITCVVFALSMLKPSSILAWASLSSFCAAVSAGTWQALGSALKARKAVLRDPGYFLLVALGSTVLGVLILVALYRLLPLHLNMLAGGVSIEVYIACAAVSGAIAAFYLSFVPMPEVRDVDDMAHVHVEFYWTAAAISVVVCMFVQHLNSCG